jgi:septum formation protein
MQAPLLARERPLLLGSGSPRRAQILEGLGVPILVRTAEIDEGWREGESPERYVERIVGEKAEAVRERVAPLVPKCPALLVADTLVTLDGEVLGKPRDLDESRRMLAQLSNRTHRVLTRFRVERRDGEAREMTVATEVTFRELPGSLIEAYAQTGEGLDKAGSYALQGKGALLVRSVVGSVTGIIGLPATEVTEALVELGLWEPFSSYE